MASCGIRRVLFQAVHVSWRSLGRTSKRTLLSDAYRCQEVWKERLQTPVLQKVDISEFALRIQEKMDKGEVQGLDMDILANKLEYVDPQQLGFVQNLFQRFRHTNAAIDVPESLSHAVIRALVKFNDTQRLMEILQDKINYGVFLDDFSASFLMDHFIERGKYHEAAQVAYDLMLQEEFLHPLARHLAWYACDKHWRHPPPALEVDQTAQQEDDEEQWIPVRFIRHPWYDNHWDINRDSLLLGKTLTLIMQQEPQGELLTDSYLLIGLSLHEQFEDALKLLDELAEADDQVTIAREAIDGALATLEAVVTKEPPAEEKDEGLLTMDDMRPYFTAAQKEDFLQQTKEKISHLESMGRVVEVSLENLLSEKVSSLLAEREAEDVAEQHTIYRQWISDRQEAADQQLAKRQGLERREQIAQRLLELQQREEKLSYFEQEEKIMLGISRAPKFRPIEEAEEEEQYVAAPTERGRGF